MNETEALNEIVDRIWKNGKVVEMDWVNFRSEVGLIINEYADTRKKED